MFSLKDKTEIEFDLDVVDMDIWNGLENTKNKVLPRISNLAIPQATEMIKITRSIEAELKKICLNTYNQYIAKTLTGYTFRRFCKQKGCRATVNLKINVYSSTGSVCFSTGCLDH